MFRPLIDCFRPPFLFFTLSLLLAVFEGALRKWVPGFQSGTGRIVAYFSKDIFFFLGVVFLLARPSSSSPVSNRLWRNSMYASALIGAGGMLSSLKGIEPIGTILSVRALIFLPLAGVLVIERCPPFPLFGFALLTSLLTILNFGLSLIQTSLPTNHILNQYAMGGEDTIAVLSSGVRATGTFAYISGLGFLSTAGIWAGLVSICLSRSFSTHIVAVLGILSGFGCAFTSFSRGPLVMAVVMLTWFLLHSTRESRATLLWFLFLVPCVVIGLSLFSDLRAKTENVIDGTIGRFLYSSDSRVGRAVGQWGEVLEAFEINPLGNGPGTEQVASGYVRAGEMTFAHYETQLPRILNEFGFLGVLGFFALIVAWFDAMRGAKRGMSGHWKLALSTSQVYLLAISNTNLVYNHTASAITWLIGAVMLSAVSNREPEQLQVAEGYSAEDEIYADPDHPSPATGR